MSENINNIEEIIKDPLSEETRKSRKSLLAFSFIGIMMVYTGFVPTKIESMGIQFSESDQNLILISLGIVVTYFLFSFFIYGVSDFLIVRIKILNNWKSYLDKQIEIAEKPDKKYEAAQALHLAIEKQNVIKAFKNFKYINLSSKVISVFRTFLEFFIPVLIALYSIYILF